ncbi:MAG: glycerophosphodiester phosphodiesterase family protein [Syntrophobacteraceae bacterium]
MGRDVVSAVKAGFLNIGHRGARSLAPENTLAAAGKAFEIGAHMWELDVRLSRDGHPVVVHDETLERTSDVRTRFPERKPWRVCEFSLDELKSLDFGSWFNTADPFKQIAAGHVAASETARYGAERIPTLEEALLFTVRNDWLVNVEIKDLSGLPGHDAVARKTADLIVSTGALEKVIVSSFNHDYLVRVKKLERRIPTGPLVKSPPVDPVALMRELGAFTYHPAVRALRPRHLQNLGARGFGVLVWVVNSPVAARTLLRHGAAGVFSDFPQRLHDTFESERRR